METIAYRLPTPKKAGKHGDGGKATVGATGAAGDDDGDTGITKTRADVTQKGVAMIGDLRTDALHQALTDRPIEDDTLFGLLILAFGGDNVSVDSGSDLHGEDRTAICRTLTEGGVLTADRDLLRQAARRMLTGVLSCRENRSNSGALPGSRAKRWRVAPAAEHGDGKLPVVLSRGALETVAKAEGVNIAPRAKELGRAWSRASRTAPSCIRRRLFQLTPKEQEAAERAPVGHDTGWVQPDDRRRW